MVDKTEFRKRRIEMEKIVKLCKDCSCCPVVRVTDDKVTIGEEENTCVLTSEQWNILKEKILRKEI